MTQELRIEFRARALPSSGTLVVLAADGVARGAGGQEVDTATDGLLAAFNADDEKFGRERAEAAAVESAARQSSAEAILHDILWAQRQFTGRHRSSDDCTLLVTRVTGPDAPDGAAESE